MAGARGVLAVAVGPVMWAANLGSTTSMGVSSQSALQDNMDRLVSNPLVTAPPIVNSAVACIGLCGGRQEPTTASTSTRQNLTQLEFTYRVKG